MTAPRDPIEAPRTVIRRDGSATVVRGDGFALDVPEWAVASIQRKGRQDAVLVIEQLIAANAGLELNGADEAMEWVAGRSSDPEPAPLDAQTADLIDALAAHNVFSRLDFEMFVDRIRGAVPALQATRQRQREFSALLQEIQCAYCDGPAHDGPCAALRATGEKGAP